MRKNPGTDGNLPYPDEDKARTEEAKRAAEDYAGMLREMLNKLRKWFN